MPSNNPYGFVPTRHLSGGLIRANEYRIASTSGTTIGTGDPVKLLSTGYIDQAAAGDRILGIFAGCQYTATDGSVVFSKHWPASTTLQTGSICRAMVFDDPQILYRVQSGGTMTFANAGELADHVVGTVNTTTGQSGAYLNSSTGTGAAGFRIHRLIDEPGNSGAYASIEVQIFEHEFQEHSQATPGV